jgi:hypothetical protein
MRDHHDIGRSGAARIQPAFPGPFTSTSAASTLQRVGKVKLTCTADTNKGEVIAAGSALVIRMLLGGPVDVPLTTVGAPLEESGLASTEKVTFAAPIAIIA